MEIQQTTIAIRERSFAEILDLSLHVTRRYAGKIAFTMAMGVLPLMLANFALTGLFLRDLGRSFPAAYLWSMSVLIYLQAQLAAVFTTFYIGRAVFNDEPTMSQTIEGVWKGFSRLFVAQGLLRGVLPGMAVVGLSLLVEDEELLGVVLGLLLPVVAIIAGIVRAVRPFVNEMIILEQLPLVAKTHGEMTLGARSQSLHSGASGDLFGRGIVQVVVGLVLAVSFYGAALFGYGLVTNSWTQGALLLCVIYPLALWSVAAISTVSRFLQYLDIRIRQEGWEVELGLRNEGDRIAKRIHSSGLE